MTAGKRRGLKVTVNRAVYGLIRPAVQRSAARQGLGSAVWHPMYWTKFPFSLDDTVLETQGGEFTFQAIDTESIEHWNHLPRYEPMDWISPSRGDVVLDIGAFEGRYMAGFSRAVGADGLVVAFEPNPITYRALVRNVGLNDASNVIVLPAGAGRVPGTMELSLEEVHRVWTHQTDHGPTFSARCVTVDAVVDTLGIARVDWIKMDVEGAELDVLRGATQVLKTSAPSLFIEVHSTREALATLLGEFGYEERRWQSSVADGTHGWILATPA